MKRSGHPTQRERERVLVCGVLLPGQTEEHDGALSEARGLAAAAGCEVVGPAVLQRRERADSATLLGKGKVQEVLEAAREFHPDAIVVDNDLTPGQARNLEKAWSLRVVDRSELILDIFARRAATKQARLQVELAQTEYQLPRLKRMWTHLERFEGGIGMRGPGETQLETDKRLIRKRIQALREELSEIEQRTRRQVRLRAGQFTVGLVGYTNAGKSTLLNRLTGASELAADMLFATLDTRTRAWQLPDGRKVLLSDTVGFLQRLPHHLVASFHATLEEALSVDLLLHVADASHPDVVAQVEAVESVLREAGRLRPADVLVLNKVDRLDPSHPVGERLLGTEQEVVRVSARSGRGLDTLAKVVMARLDARSAIVEVVVPFRAGRELARLRAEAVVLAEKVAEQGLCLELKLHPSSGQLLRDIEASGGEVRSLRAPREHGPEFVDGERWWCAPAEA
ncbi:MAG: GTPase HflX [Planctomycetes bacterium]|nr:GTPase HflX [Planctomycetota bacterium]